MPALTKCRWCGEVLVCEKCGKRQTPELKRKGERKMLQVYLSPGRAEAVKEAAKEAGMNVSEYLASRLSPEFKAEHGPDCECELKEIEYLKSKEDKE